MSNLMASLNGGAESVAPPPSYILNTARVQGGVGGVPPAYRGSYWHQLSGVQGQSTRMFWRKTFGGFHVQTTIGQDELIALWVHPYHAFNGAGGPNYWRLDVQIDPIEGGSPTTIRSVTTAEVASDEPTLI